MLENTSVAQKCRNEQNGAQKHNTDCPSFERCTRLTILLSDHALHVCKLIFKLTQNNDFLFICLDCRRIAVV